MQKESLVKLGKISKAHGLKGELTIQLVFDAADSIDSLESVYLDVQGKLIPFFVESLKGLPNKKALLRLEDCQSLNDTSKFIGKDVYVPEDLLELDDPLAILATLEGFELVDKTLGKIGPVLEVLELPGQHMLKVKAGALEPLVPFNDTFILKIDKKKRVIECDLPEGLLEL